MRKEAVEWLAALGRLWGLVRFRHPWLAERPERWDAAVAAAVPRLVRARTDRAAERIVAAALGALDDSATALLVPRRPLSERQLLVERPHAGAAILLLRNLDLSDWYRSQDRLEQAVRSLTGRHTAVLDLRRVSPGLSRLVVPHLGLLLGASLRLPSSRYRVHSGFVPENGRASGGYYSGFIERDGYVIARQPGDPPTQLAVIVDASASQSIALAAALYADGLANVVVEGKVPDGDCVRFQLPSGRSVRVRVSDWLINGQRIRMPPPISPRAALRVALSGAPPAPARAATAGPAAVEPVEVPGGSDLPSAGLRVLALYKLWNVVAFFFPYLELLDRPWDDVLPELIPAFWEASDALTYALAVTAAAVSTQDSHTRVHCQALVEHLGVHSPPLAVRLVQGETVVTWSGHQSVEVGDVIRAVDSQAIGDRRNELRPLFAASTDQALAVRIDSSVLAGSKGSIAQLELEGPDGVTRTVGLARTKEHVAPPAADGKPYRTLPSGLGYVDLTRLRHEQVDEALASVWLSPGVIFDLRGYPHGTAWPISARLTSRSVLAARFRRPEVGPDGGYRAFDQWTPTPIGPRYEGRVVVLIDERAISQAEHTCLFLEATSHATFVGSATQGANGDVTWIALPGGVGVTMSGHDVRHADGRQLQRVGIAPHVCVYPTVAGIRAGRDEVLEAAIAYLQG